MVQRDRVGRAISGDQQLAVHQGKANGQRETLLQTFDLRPQTLSGCGRPGCRL
jgi:hypothetical protein